MGKVPNMVSPGMEMKTMCACDFPGSTYSPRQSILSYSLKLLFLHANTKPQNC